MASIQGIYIALFGRPADLTGLAYFNAETNNGADLSAIGDLAGTAEYQDRFDGLSNVQIVTRIYQELFGRDPDASGLAYFVAALNSGQQTINTIAINVLDGAQGTDADIVANKVAAAELFTAEIDTAIEIGAYVGADAADLGRAYISAVTADDATIPTQAEAAAAVQGVVDFGFQGNTFDVANGTDVIVGSNPAADSSNNNDVITVIGNYDGSGDINAGLGTDRVNVSVATPVEATTATSLVGVERLYVTATANAALNVEATVGLQQLWASNSGAFDLDFDNIIDTTIVGGVEGTNGDVYFDFDTDGSDDAATIVVDGTATGLYVDEIEALTINVAGPSGIGFFGGDAETVSITGTGDLSFVVDGFATDVVIDASAHVGKLTVDTNAYDDLTVIGGAQNDAFIVDGNSEGVTLTGNAGADLFTVSVLTNINAAADIVDDLIAISDFDGAADTLALTVTGAEDTLTNTEVSNIGLAADLAAALAVAGAATGVDQYSIFQYDGSTYIYQNDNVAGLGVGDGVIELTGFTGDFTATNLQLA